jgi:hypothetical protein
MSLLAAENQAQRGGSGSSPRSSISSLRNGSYGLGDGGSPGGANTEKIGCSDSNLTSFGHISSGIDCKIGDATGFL